jgi:hypothetical protein
LVKSRKFSYEHHSHLNFRDTTEWISKEIIVTGKVEVAASIEVYLYNGFYDSREEVYLHAGGWGCTNFGYLFLFLFERLSKNKSF